MKKTIPSLNGLRALSILLVVIGHTQVRNFHLKNTTGAQMGVTIFFIISGFLITYLLMKEEQGNDGRISLKSFYLRRTFRIFPVYYALLLVYFVLQVLGLLQFTSASWISSITYTKNFSHDSTDWETAHLWSLSVEEQFYLVWPTVFYFFKRYRAQFAMAVVAVVPFVRGWGNYDVLHLCTRADALMAGCLFALYYDQVSDFLNTRARKLLVLPFAGLLCCLFTKRIINVFFKDSHHAEQVALAFGGTCGTIALLCVGLILIISVNYTNNPWFRFLNIPFMNYLGKLSYSIYIWQQMFFSTKLWPASQFPWNFIFMTVTAVLSYHLLEMPFLKIRDRFREQKKEPVSADAARLLVVKSGSE
jgi:peptidoglycan/LPS O-acetylase OafA/YrhL